MLDIDWVTILFEILNFVILTVILYFLAFKPIVRQFEERAREKERLMDEMVRDREEAARYLAEIEARLNNLDAEIQKITDEAYEYNKNLQAELLSATQEEAERILQDALLDIRKKQSVDLKQNQSQLVDAILSISTHTLRQVTPLAVHDALIEELTKKIWDLGKTNMMQVQSLRESLEGRAPVVSVITPLPLSSQQELNLVRTFSALADKDIDLDIATDENLIAGIKIRIADMIIDNSLAAHLDAMRGEVEQSLDQIDIKHDD